MNENVPWKPRHVKTYLPGYANRVFHHQAAHAQCVLGTYSSLLKFYMVQIKFWWAAHALMRLRMRSLIRDRAVYIYCKAGIVVRCLLL